MKEIKITLDFTNMEYPAQLHRELKIKFELPDYYSENWDALWDCLDGWYEDDENVTVEIKGLETVSDDMRQYAQTMLKVFDDVHSNSPNVIFKKIPTCIRCVKTKCLSQIALCI